MSEQYLDRRYLQIRVMLVAAVLGLIAQGGIWFSGVMKSVENTWVKWPFRLAVGMFVFTILDLFMPALEVKVAIDKHRYLSPAEKQELDKIFYSGVLVLAVGCVAFLFVIYKLISHTS